VVEIDQVRAGPVIKAAEDSLGLTDVLRAAREHIESGSPFASVAFVSCENDPLPGAKLARLDFLQMDREGETLCFRKGSRPWR
jgi:hypothetical protein